MGGGRIGMERRAIDAAIVAWSAATVCMAETLPPARPKRPKYLIPYWI